MPQSHHRKKHKEHLKNYHQQHTGQSPHPDDPKRSNATLIFALLGALIGLAIPYFAGSGGFNWLAIGAIAGGLGGFFVGRLLEKDSTKA